MRYQLNFFSFERSKQPRYPRSPKQIVMNYNKCFSLNPTTLFLTAIFFLSSCAFTSSLPAWVKLGTKTVSFGADWDELVVTGRQGTFNAIKLKVERSDVHFDRVIVHYRNRTREVLPIRKRIAAGGETRVINLKGANRIIRKIDFHYTTPLRDGKKARVIVFGRH